MKNMNAYYGFRKNTSSVSVHCCKCFNPSSEVLPVYKSFGNETSLEVLRLFKNFTFSTETNLTIFDEPIVTINVKYTAPINTEYEETMAPVS